MNLINNYKKIYFLSKSYMTSHYNANDKYPSENNHLYIYPQNHGDFKEIIMDNQIIIQAPLPLCSELEKLYVHKSPQWSSEFFVLNKLNTILGKQQLEIDETKLYFLPHIKNAIDISQWTKAHPEIELIKIEKDEISQSEHLKRFGEAFLFDPDISDEIGYLASYNGKIIAAAGATSDYENMWQMGIDVDTDYRCDSLGAVLIQKLSEAILEKNIIPYYGTAASHIASQKVALKAGFKPSWFEITSRKL